MRTRELGRSRPSLLDELFHSIQLPRSLVADSKGSGSTGLKDASELWDQRPGLGLAWPRRRGRSVPGSLGESVRDRLGWLV